MRSGTHSRKDVMMAEPLALPAMEWEPLLPSSDWTFDLPEKTPLGAPYTSVRIFRDTAWNLHGEATGTGGQLPGPVAPTTLRAGQLLSPEPLIVAKMAGSELELRDVHPGDYSGDLTGAARRALRIAGASITFLDRDTALKEARTCSVWCLNAPVDDFVYPRRTVRKRIFRYERRREGFSDQERELRGEGFSQDAAAIPPPGCGAAPAAFSLIPKGVPIDYAFRPAAIEFTLSAAACPNWEEVDAYLQAVSFVVGRRLIPVGMTLFDGQARQRLHELRSAWSIDLRAECSRQSMSPVPLDDVESALGNLVPKFLSADNTFALSDGMWRVWLSSVVPMEAALPNLAAALECIMTAWFKSTKTKSSAKYMPDAQWSGLATKPLAELKTALGTYPTADRILRRASGANNFGVNERFERFFEEIGLQVGDVELAAINARNKAAHGGTFTPAQYQWLADTVRAYQTMISRVILRLLEWPGLYIDYSTYDFPARDVAAPLGGPANDGKAAKF